MNILMESTQDFNKSLSIEWKIETAAVWFTVTFSKRGVYKRIDIKDFKEAIETYNNIENMKG